MPGTRYDIFLTVAAKGEVSTSEVQQITEITRDIQFNQDVQILFANNLIEKSGKTLKFPQNSENAQLLLDVLSFALMHDINYNNYITSPMMVFLEQTYNQNFFTFSSVQQPEETKTKNISILRKNGFLLTYQESPFTAKIIQNSFLDLILKLNNRVPEKENKKFKPVAVDPILMEEGMKQQMASKFGTVSKYTEVKYITEDDPSRDIMLNLTPLQKEMKKTIEEKDPETLNTTFKENFEKASRYMRTQANQGRPLSIELLLEYHKLLMNDPEIGGILRTEPVQVTGNPYFKICPHKKIEQTLKKLIEKYNKAKFKGLPQVIEFGAFLHNELQHTHPFVDGNSRLTRLVLEHFFNQNKLPNYEIPPAYISKYTQYTKGARNRDDKKLFNLFKEIFLFQLRKQA